MQSACNCVSWIRLEKDQRYLPQVVPSTGAQGDAEPLCPPLVMSPGPLQSRGAAHASACSLHSAIKDGATSRQMELLRPYGVKILIY